ncbi:zinc ribbon domain-containing protein [Paenibacillus amylolyticus]|uniref:zinc ribbon domain-containing protein n=1 Tax=Paenibacillus amylolyticus TaxID=1451 RepID=UPI003EBCFBBC
MSASQSCSACGDQTGKITSHIEWRCANCGVHHVRDINVSSNIRAEGLPVASRSGIPLA